MSTVLLLWNPTGPRGVEWTDHMGACHNMCVEADEDRALGGDARVRFGWDTGRRNSGIDLGDRVLVLKVGDEERGIVRDGTVLGAVETGTGRWKHIVPVEWDNAVPEDEPLTTATLKRRIPGVKWDRQQTSGWIMPDATAEAVERLWLPHVERHHRRIREMWS